MILDVAAIIPAANIDAIDPRRLLDTRLEGPPPVACDPSYPGQCISPPPPVLDCADVAARDFPVVGADPHDFDTDGDGVGCESAPPADPSSPPPAPPSEACHPSYPEVCIPPPPPDLNCGDIPFKNIRVVGSDPNKLDGDGDGVACTT